VNDFEFEKAVKESRAAIESCDLTNCGHTEHMKTPMALFAVDEKNIEAVVANDTILSIVAGMTKENKEIVKDCMLYSSLAADSLFPGGGVNWYGEFKKRMAFCGWPSQSAGLSDYRTSNSRFTMEQEGLKILASAVAAMAVPGPTSALLLKVAKDAIDVLQASEKPLRLFESSSKTPKGAKFAIASAVESQDGEVIIALGAVDFAASLNVTNVLFWEWNSSSISIKRAENHMILNQRHFHSIADLMREKLTAKAREALAELDF